MRLALSLVAVSMLVAGCSSDATQDAAAPPEAVAEAAKADTPFEQAFALRINPDLEVMAIGGASENCVFFWDTAGARYTLRNVTATLEWDALTPAAEELRIRITGASEDLVSDAGRSPVLWTLPEAKVTDGWGLGFWADYSMQAPVMQPATLTLSFEHEGRLPAPSVGTCGGGGL